MDLKVLLTTIFTWLTASLVITCFAEESVPFIAWSNQKYLDNLPSRPVGHIVENEFLLSNLVNRILQNEVNQVVFLFMFNQLSIDDISKYSSAYAVNNNGGNLQNLKHSYEQASSHLSLPMVEPVSLSNIKEAAIGPVMTYDDQWTKKLTKDKVNLFLVPIKVTSDRASSFSEADSVLKTVMDGIIGHGIKYTAMLTASQASKIPLSYDNEHILQVGRHLMEAKTDDYSLVKFQDEGCNGLLYIKTIEVWKGNDNFTVPASQDWDTSGSSCNQTSTSTFIMTKTFTENSNVTKFSMTFEVKLKLGNRWWNFTENTLKYTLNGDEQTYMFKIDPDTPTGNYSFHCGNQTFSNPSKDSKDLVRLIDFQMQPFNVTDDRFDRANDCVGFFTPGIWMGLCTSFILVLILYFGVSMLASLTVMDQFDDPKGKTITVNVVE